jgi:predicted transcriptional regulator of viral defense system
MATKSKTKETELYEIALGQLGFFTAQQAIAAGFSVKNHAYHLKAGNWQREGRGIYRLAHFPLSEHAGLMALYLSFRNKKGEYQGAFSLHTALDLWELSDINPVKIHMTVPLQFRKRVETIPEYLVLHKKDLNPNQVIDFHGMKITTPLQTLIDVVEDGRLSPELIEQAFHQARNRGLILEKELAKISTDLYKKNAILKPRFES